ncbi:MAG: acetyl-CoA carboxylase biotin carboxylase subunit [Acidobacteriota bacterium]
MFKKILIANRGEIALRIIWACRELGIKTVAVHSEADADSLHVKFADDDVCIGPPAATGSYLNVTAIIAAAEITGADAIHPGYGFLAESAHFAEVCEACNIRFIGPGPDVIRMMGDKARARQAMSDAHVPCVPGSGLIEEEQQALDAAESVGYPLLIKASAGGGGKGMRVVEDRKELLHMLPQVRNEAEQAFGSGAVYLERYLARPRHVEFQVFGDNHGNIVHMGERECSVQRRHQKLLEESPSPALDETLRRTMAEAAVRAARSVNYSNAGTVEFLLDGDRNFYFIEMNTRIQVEHPVTEGVTGLDLVKEQIQVAAGAKLSVRQDDIRFTGHAIECRINAEDPETYTPSPGRIETFHLPGGPGLRVDTAAHADCVVSPYYDSMIAKLITRGNNRSEAVSRMRRALESFIVEGIKTTIPLQLRILSDPDFVAGRIDTHFMERLIPSRPRKRSPPPDGPGRETVPGAANHG